MVAHSHPHSSRDGHLSFERFLERRLERFFRKTGEHKRGELYSLLSKEFEKALIFLTLRRTQGNQRQAAELLGINRNTLRKKIKELKVPLI